MNVKFLCTLLVLLFSFAEIVAAQITERPRPDAWKMLVPGARFIDRFLPMKNGELRDDAWGAKNVLPRFVDNGIEDSIRSYWGGNILLGKDNKYHLYVCGWPENSPKGHHMWPRSTVYHAVCENSTGPFIIKDTIGPGHNPEAFLLKNGQYAIYVIDGYYLADTVDGPWTYNKFEFNNRDRKIIEGLSNLTFAQREDGSYLMVCRGGGVWISQTGLSSYNQITDKRVYPPVAGEFEDPVVWRDHIQYHLIVNDWLGRIAFYLRSKDGINWVTDPGEAYLPGVSVHEDGTVEDWFKYERLKIFQDKYGRAIQANFAVIDTLKDEDKASDRHSSKNISIPLNPGLLITMLNSKPLTPKTKTIEIRIAAENGFDPQTCIDINSLRFGASSEVNFGRGCKVLKTENEGADLIVTFDAAGNGITSEEFAPKLIGKTVQGNMLYGYTRVPWINYDEPVLSARMPVFASDTKDMAVNINIQNFGCANSQKARVEVFYLKDKQKIKIGSTDVPPLKAYGETDVTLTYKELLEKGKEYDFIITITGAGYSSNYSFKTTVG